MRLLNKTLVGAFAACVGFGAAAAYADDIRVGITMRMVSENGQAYGQMMMDEIKGINEAGGIHGKMIKATLMNDECKSDKEFHEIQCSINDISYSEFFQLFSYCSFYI